MCKASVVIPNFNGMAYLDDCLLSLRGQSETDFEIILVDNGSSDESVSYVREHDPKARIIKLGKNYGFCRAVNVGIKNSKAPYVILLNNDTKVDKNFVKALLEEMGRHTNCFSCQARMLKMHDPSLMDDGGNYYCALGWAFARGKGKPSGLYQEPCGIFASCAGAAIYQKSLFDEIGFFDEAHYAYLEDVDIGYRARIYGYENRYAPNALAYHVGSGTSGSKYNEFKIGYSAGNNLYLIYKNMPALQIILNLPFLAVGFIIKGIFFGKKGYFKEYMKGLERGIRLCLRGKKVKFEKKNFKNYVQIQLELWINIARRLNNKN